MQAIVDSATRLTGADRVSLILFDWEAGEVQQFLRGGKGWSEVMTTIGFDELSSGLSGWVFQTGEVALSPKSPPDPRESPAAQSRRRETSCGSILVAPLGPKGNHVGTITAIHRLDHSDFLPEDAEALRLFCWFATERILLLRTKTAVLEAQTAAEVANRSKTNFLSNLSHELRTPLNGILGFSHLLEVSRLDSSQRSMVRTIAQSGQRLLATVDNLLELAQFESGQFHLEVSPFSPESVLLSVVSKNEPLAKEKALEWAVETGPGVPPILQGDAVRLGLAWNHILSNAVKFTDRGSISVLLEAKRLTEDRYELDLTVEDTGIGMVTDRFGNGFVPFQQEDSSPTRKFGGTGLGLALADRIARKMKGGLELWGEPGVGTRVRVRVELGIEGVEVRPVSQLRVLLQDPDSLSRLAMVGMLEKLGHRVDLVSTPQQAEERMGTAVYEAVMVEFPTDAPIWGRLTDAAAGKKVLLVGLAPLDFLQPQATPWTVTIVKPVTYLGLQEVLKHCLPKDKP